jgi:hypothetical protein
MTLTSSIKGTLGPIALLSAFSMLFLGPSASNASTSDSVEVVVQVENACDENQVVELGFEPVWADYGMGVMLDAGGMAQATYVDFNIDDPIDCYGDPGGFGQVEFTETEFGDPGITTTFECDYSDNSLSDPALSASKFTCDGAGGSPRSIKLSVSADGTVAQDYYTNTLLLTLLPASD